MNDYDKFLETKRKTITDSGFSIDEQYLNPLLFDFQKFTVCNALRKGKYAIFADCGCGKSFMQIEWAYQVSKHTDKPVLILAPLAVVAQTIAEADHFGYKIHTIGTGLIQITNYEQLDNIERSLHLWTNKGDIVYTPFLGIGSELYQSLKMGRKGMGGELKSSYFELAGRNCTNAELANGQMLMFS